MFRLASIPFLLLLTSKFIAQAADPKLIHSRDEPSADSCSKRTLFEIIFGCVSTTIICAWAAIHPNIPPQEGPFKGTLRRVELMFWTVVAPEILPAWALNQLLAAKTVRDLYNKEKGYKEESRGVWKEVKRWFSLYERKEAAGQAWTLKHGHFLIMGGIHLVEPADGNAAPAPEATTGTNQPESFSDDIPNVQPNVQPTESIPLEEETNSDTEKGFIPRTPDLEEGRVTILTLGMLRELVKDPEIKIRITEDDIMHRSKGDALSKSIFMLQTSWFIVQCIARRVQGLALSHLEITTLAMASLNGITWILWWEKPLGAQAVVRVYVNRKLTDEERDVERSDEAARSALVSGLREVFEEFGVMSTIHDRDWTLLFFLSLFMLPVAIVGLPILILSYFAVTMYDLLVGASFSADATHVSTFYVPSSKYDSWPILLLLFLGSIFGGIHCAGWNIPFPTHAQQHLWRIASLAVTIIPTGLPIAATTIGCIVALPLSIFSSNSFASASGMGAVIPGIIGIFMYAAARLFLLGQAIALLRHLPPSALVAVDWTKYYPHIF